MEALLSMEVSVIRPSATSPGSRSGHTALSLDVVRHTEVDTELPSDNATGVFDASLQDSGCLQVGYADDKNVRILTDLHNIYTSPIKINKPDLCLLLVGGGSLLLVDQDVYNRINAGPKTPRPAC